MKGMGIGVIVFLFILILAGNVNALDVTTDSCYTFVDNNTYVTMNASITAGGTTCFFCEGFENITLDCNGYAIQNYGYVFRDNGCNNITMKNCSLLDNGVAMRMQGGVYEYRNHSFYNINFTSSGLEASFIYTLFGGGTYNTITLYNVTYDTSNLDYMYYLEGANAFNVSHFNVTYINNNYLCRVPSGTPNFFLVDYYWMNVSVLNATDSEILPNVTLSIIDKNGIRAVNATTDENGNYYDYLSPSFLNQTTSGTSGATISNPNNITGSKTGYETNATQFNVVQDGMFNLHLLLFIPDIVPPEVIIQSPMDAILYNPQVWFNLTMNDTHPDTCIVNWGQGNRTMTNSTGNWNYYNQSMPEGSYTIDFWCNDTSGNVGYNTTSFDIDLPPVIMVSACMNLPRNNTIYRLTNNISTGGSTCFDANLLQLNNITIDCDGYTVESTSGFGNEAKFARPYTDMALKRCNITGWSHVLFNGADTISILAENTYVFTANHDTPDFMENIAGIRNITVTFINFTQIGQGGGENPYLFQNDNANFTAYAINSSWSGLNPLYRKYTSVHTTYFVIYKMFITDFTILQAGTSNPISNAVISINDTYGNPYTTTTDSNGNANIILNYYNCSTSGTALENFNCGENYYNPYDFTITKSGYASNSSEFNVTSNQGYVVYLTQTSIPVIDQLPSITAQLVVTLGFGIMGLFAILTLLGLGYIDSTGKPDTDTFIKIIVSILIIILAIVAVWQGLVI